MDENIARLIAFVAFVGAMSISITYRHQADRQGNPMRSNEGTGLVAFLRLIGLLLLLPFFAYLINPDWFQWAQFSVPGALRWVAAGVALLCVPLVYWVFSTIGGNISPTQATRTDHQLITSGPYRWVRHPLYTVGFVLLIALALVTGVWTLGVMGIGAVVALLLRTPTEEARLIETFGDDYRAYMRRTGRFIPRLSR